MAEAAVLALLGWFASPLIKMLFDKAHHHLGTGIDERRKILAATVLPHLSLAIEKAEKSPHKEKLVDWLNRLKGAYYEAEEAMDLFEYEMLKQKVKDDRKTVEQKEKNERGTRISLPSQLSIRPLKIASVNLKNGLSVLSRQKLMLKVCIDKLIEIAKEANEFRDLLEVPENARGSDSDRETTSDPPSHVFGRERDKQIIVGLLTKKPLMSWPAIPIVIKNTIEIIVGWLTKKYLNSEPGASTKPAIPVIAITGRSGVGKTALAQYVYKHMDGQEHFDLCVWVYAPRKFNATDVIKNMIEIIKAKETTLYDCKFNSFTSLEALSTQITSMLRPKKLLLVLDDFWTDTEDFKDQWEKFIKIISSCLSGSRVLLTTQYKNAAKLASVACVTEVETYYLREIEDCHFSELFLHYALPSNSHLRKEEFEKIGRKIAIKLKGDPGAAKLVGYQLSGKLDLSHWEEVAQKDWLGDNMKARIWSYQQLPLDLQRCFAICSLFPKGFHFHKNYLTRIWMAEGFIRPIDKEARLEDVSENNLNELVSRFFFEEVEVKKIKKYQLHDLLHDLAERVQGDDFIRIDSTNSREVSSNISLMLSRSENIRHIYINSNMIKELKEKICLMNNIRTFVMEDDGGFVPKKILEEILTHLEKLRMLVLPNCGDQLPVSIGNLKHLRFLYIIGGSQPLKKLPDSICKLYHLQTLRLPDCESLPKYFSDLISLRQIGTVGETMSHISHVGRLKSLQTLDQFIVRKEPGNELHQLENLDQLRGKMCITGLENVGSATVDVKANLKNKKHLKKLVFEWNSDKRDTDSVTRFSTEHVQLLDALKPHPNITALTLKGFGGDRFPSWLLSENSLEHLTWLSLDNCDRVAEIPSIHESLPNCKSLVLWGLKNLKKIPFLPPNLTYLVINHIPRLSYFSKHDLLMKEERKKFKHEVVMQIAECLKFKYEHLAECLRHFLLLVKERLQVEPETCITSSQYENSYSEIVKFDIFNCDYSWDQLIDAWVMFMHYHIETMFNKNEEYKLALPSSLTHLWISSCSIADDALSTCIQCLVSLCKLKLSEVHTITTLPPKEVLRLLKNLRSLTIKDCYLLSSLGGIGALTSLIVLKLHGCLSLSISNESLPSSLKRIKFRECSNVDVILAKSNLPVLHTILFCDIITFKNRKGVLHVGHLSCLKLLVISGWDGRLEGLSSLTALNYLQVVICPEINISSSMDKYACGLQYVAVDNLLLLKRLLSNETILSIEHLLIGFFQGDSADDMVFQSLTSLKHLYFNRCNITHLPKNMKNNLPSLQYLDLKDCPNLCELELEELPRKLHELDLKGCPTLMEKFNKDGPYRVQFHEGVTKVKFPTKEEGNRF